MIWGSIAWGSQPYYYSSSDPYFGVYIGLICSALMGSIFFFVSLSLDFKASKEYEVLLVHYPQNQTFGILQVRYQPGMTEKSFETQSYTMVASNSQFVPQPPAQPFAQQVMQPSNQSNVIMN